MDAQIFPWIKDDVAIEIIGKMIAEQVAPLNELMIEATNLGFDCTEDSDPYHPGYLKYTQRISELNEEINQIYRGDNLAEIHRKVDEQYAPHLKAKFSQDFVKV